MKIAVECQSPLLQKSLEIFLEKHISTIKQCDIVIRDVKSLDDEKCFYISSDKESDLFKPFSCSQLISALENRYDSMNFKEIRDTPLEFSILEKRIESLTKEYQQNILKAVRAFYEK
ncbi:MAG: hypothetical protein U9P72_09675 [Campylobacterota bacterium]|nr:hypothetical protein [Campylobacterota bacterium]